MPLFISGSNGISGADGTAALPAVQGTDGDTGVFFPAANQVAIATGGTQRLLVDASGIVTGTAGNLMLVSGTAVASTSGTSIDFTGIPSWARRVTVIFNGVSTTGTSAFLLQLGSGSITTSGYTSVGSGIAATVSSTTSTAGFVAGNVNTAASLASGLFVFVNVSGTTWAGSGSVSQSAIPQTNLSTGNSPALSGALDRVRITTVGGTDTFDAGSINILFE